MIIEISTKNIESILNKKPDFSIERLVIGFFDGLHNGHLKLFNENLANTSVITFINHPNKNNNLYTDEERINQLGMIGIKNIYVYDLKQNLTALEFINKYLKKLNPKKIVVGDDFKFGNDIQDVDYLSKFFDVQKIEKYNNISTSLIKSHILNGDFEKANDLLVFPYYRIGAVQKGNGNGKKLQANTANIEIDDELIPIPFGIYATKTKLHDIKYKSVTFVGNSKTLDKQHEKPRIETHILEYNGEEFYDEDIKICFYKKIGIIKKYLFRSTLIRKINKLKKIALNYNWFKSSK